MEPKKRKSNYQPKRLIDKIEVVGQVWRVNFDRAGGGGTRLQHHFDVIESKLLGNIFALKGYCKVGKGYRCGQAEIIIKVMCYDDGFLQGIDT